MATITAAETRLRSAGRALEHGLRDEDGGSAIHVDLDRLADEQQQVHEATASLIARMNDPRVDEGDLNRLARDVTRMLAIAEDLRHVRAKTASRRLPGGRAWRERLDLD